MSIINKPPQHVKREYELEEPVALVVEKYATFIDSTPDHVVNSALKMLCSGATPHLVRTGCGNRAPSWRAVRTNGR
jgi:hypothetical protein